MMLERPPDKRARATERKREYRKRLKDGSGVLSVPVKDLNAVIEVVLDLHWLPEGKFEALEPAQESRRGGRAHKL